MATASSLSSPLQLPSLRASAKNLLPRRAPAGAPAGSHFVKRDFVHNGRSYNQFSPLKQRGGLQVAVLPVTPPLLHEEKRRQMSEDYGFKQIGEQLPDNVILEDVMDTLPKKVFETDDAKAWTSVLISVTSYALGLFLISKAPWYLLPLAWAWTGTAITGYINEAKWNWQLMKTIMTTCHVYDKERYYTPFDELTPEESQPINFLKKIMPDYAS